MKKRKQTRKTKLADILAKQSHNILTPEQEEIELEEKIEAIDEEFAILAKYIGRELSEDEEIEVMDIIDELTPKNKDGRFLVDPLPFDYAWRIYEARKDAKLDEFLGQLEVD